MDFFSLGDHINVKEFNALTYLLRKFKRLTTPLTLGALTLESDYGSFTFDNPLTSVGGNFIIEEEIHISSENCLKNCYYSFVFSVIDVNTSGLVNKRQVKVTGNTGDDGSLFITLPTNLIEEYEVILPDFELSIVFNPHEYYTNVVDVVNVDLVTDKQIVNAGETATITATLTDSAGDVLASVPCTFIVNSVAYSKTTDSDGQATYQYTGTGISTKIDIQVVTTNLTIYDSVMTATVTGGSVSLGKNMVATEDSILIGWGDGTTTTRQSNNGVNSSHTYTDGETEHTIAFVGEITSFGTGCFRDCRGLTSITIPNTVTSLGTQCFYHCSGLTSITIPNTVTSLGDYCFYGCSSLIDYQLYWKDSAVIDYDSNKMPVKNNTYFTIPQGQRTQYINKNYPNKIKIRGYDISLTIDKTVITEDETSTVTATLTYNTEPISDETISYTIKQGSTVIDTGTDTTDSNGQIEVEYTGTSAGKINIIFTYDTLTESTTIYDTITYDNATTTDHNDIWVVNTSAQPAILTRGNNHSTIAQQNTGTNGWVHYLLGDRTNKIVEFDIRTTGTNSRVGLRNGTSVINVINDLNNEWNHIIIDFDNNIIYNTTTDTTKNISSSTINRIYFEARGNGEMVSFKNFMVYSSDYNRISTSVSLSSDKVSYYTDESIVLSGTLVDDNSLPLVGADVKVYRGSSLVDTVSTDDNGEYEKTITGLSAGSYSFKAVYDGDDTYQDSTSSTISVIVQDHTYSLSISSDKQILLTTESVTISGTLLKDSTAFSSQSVDLYDGITKITTVTTDNNGEYEETVSGLSVGVHTFKAVNANVESSTISITVNEPTPVHDYSLSVASTKNILSYADSESATITGTLTDGGVAVSGETLSYVIKHDSTTITSGSDTTDANGEISFTYASTGIGDVTVEVDYSTLLQETCAIEDIILYDPMTSNSGHWDVPSDATYGYNEYSSNGWKIGNASAFKRIALDTSLTLPFKISFIINEQNGNVPSVEFGGKYVEFYNNRISINGSTNYHTLQIGSEYSVYFYSDKIEVYKDNTYIGRNNISVPQTNPLYFQTGSNRYMRLKDVKIKAL